MSKITAIIIIVMGTILSGCGTRQSVKIPTVLITVSGDNAQAVTPATSTLTATRQQAEPSPGFVTVSIPVELKLTAHLPAGTQSSRDIELHLFDADGKRLATLSYSDTDNALPDFLTGDTGATCVVCFSGIVAKADFSRLAQATTARITGFSFLQPRARAMLPALS